MWSYWRLWSSIIQESPWTVPTSNSRSCGLKLYELADSSCDKTIVESSESKRKELTRRTCDLSDVESVEAGVVDSDVE